MITKKQNIECFFYLIFLHQNFVVRCFFVFLFIGISSAVAQKSNLQIKVLNETIISGSELIYVNNDFAKDTLFALKTNIESATPICDKLLLFKTNESQQANIYISNNEIVYNLDKIDAKLIFIKGILNSNKSNLKKQKNEVAKLITKPIKVKLNYNQIPPLGRLPLKNKSISIITTASSVVSITISKPQKNTISTFQISSDVLRSVNIIKFKNNLLNYLEKNNIIYSLAIRFNNRPPPLV